MKRVLVGTCVLLLAVVAVRAAEEKPVGETYKAMFKELVTKYQAAKAGKERDDLLTSYGEKFVDLAKKNIKDPGAVDVLVNVLSLPIPETKDGPKSKATAMLKGVIDDKTADKKLRAKALTAYLGAQESVVMNGKDANAVETAKKEMAECRKLIETDLKGQVKDLYVGATMPELKSKNLEDKEVKLSDLKGKVVVLDVWATWCPPCRAMIPHERELVKRLKGKPFVLVSISGDDKKEALTNFLKTNDMPWTHWWEGRGPLMSQLNIQFFPTIFVLDGKGVIRYKGVRGEAMDKAVDALLKEMEEAKAKG
jgi:thiol-disulfide isomerase/thioredoxin